MVPFLVLYMVRQGYSPAQAGVAASSYGAGSMAAAVAGGYLTDTIGRKSTIALSMFGSAACMLALSQAQSLTLLILLAGLTGLASELYRPATGALLADLVPAGQRVTAFATYRLAINLGFAAGPATAGFLAQRSFSLLFLGDALTSVVFAVVALLALPSGAPSARPDKEDGGGFRPVLANRPFVLLLLANVGIAFVYFQGQSTLPLHVRDSGLSTTVYGLLLSLNGLAIVLFELPLTSITQRFPPRPIIASGLLLVGAGFALTGPAHAVAPLAITVLIWTLGEMIHSPVAQAYVADMAPVHLRGRYQGAFGFAWAVGLVLGPSLGTTLYAWNQAALWLLCGGLGVLAPLLIFAGTRHTSQRNMSYGPDAKNPK